MMSDADLEKPFVRALARGLEVIYSMSYASVGLSVADVATRVDLDRATARRILMTLEALGFVRFSDKRFFLTPKVLSLGYAYLSATPLLELARPYLSDAATAIGGSCSICVLDGDVLTYAARSNAVRRNLSQLVEIGTRLPLYATSAGKVLLAGMADDDLSDYLRRVKPIPFTSRTITDQDALRDVIREARERDWASSDQEQEDGVRSVAIPLRNGVGAIVGALNASVQASFLVQEDLETQQLEQLTALKKARSFIEPALIGNAKI